MNTPLTPFPMRMPEAANGTSGMFFYLSAIL